MFDVVVSQDVIEYARCLVARGDFGHRGRADGSREQQLTGLIGQTVVHDLFGVERPTYGERSDGGVDLVFAGIRMDVKTTGRNVRPQPHYVSSLLRVQVRSRAEALLFCSLNKRQRVLTICGWMGKGEFLKRANLYARGTLRVRDDGTSFVTKAAQYEMRNSDLNAADCLDALKRSLSKGVVPALLGR